MTEYEFSKLKIGDKVKECQFGWIGEITSINGDICSVDFIGDLILSNFDFLGNIYFLEPKTRFKSAYIRYSCLDLINE